MAEANRLPVAKVLEVYGVTGKTGHKITVKIECPECGVELILEAKASPASAGVTRLVTFCPTARGGCGRLLEVK
jgi:hypothetical protein